MAIQRTLSIIKPDAMEKNRLGAILAAFQESGFRIAGIKNLHLTRAQAEGFYAEHRARGFFDELCAFMSRGPILVLCLEREEAIAKYREVIGATDPAKAAAGTIRKDFAQSIEANAMHGSDAKETAAFEMGYFFEGMELR